ncbi:sensor histidine kinase [Bradyrhizobium sp.]|jgi:K+-sensing histidine kinase KdpD|uniref:sensor histidine kinase n=1 Tax=Bradyrhizobium sp. TaxID=376 RepID=UPI003D0F89D9
MPLNSHLPIVQKLGKAQAIPVESRNARAAQPDEEQASPSILQTEILPLLLSLTCVGLITAVLLLLDQTVAVNLVPIAYLIPVIVAATQWGIWPATLASIASMAAADFFFFPPIFSFQVEDPQEVVDLLLFLVVALVSSNLASRLRLETETLRRREKELQNLYEFSRRLAACFTVLDLILAVQTYLSRTLGQPAVFFVARADGQFELPKSGSVPKVVQDSVAAMVTTVGVPAYTITDEATGSVWLLRAVGSETAVHGLVAINIGGGSGETIEIKTQRVESILEEVSLTLHRIDIEKAMEDARLRLQAQLLRDAFHGTLSHELCSPLSAIQGSASVLGSMPQIRGDDRAQSLVEAITDEVAELDGFIQNLLNATRVTAGGVSPHLEWTDPRDIVNAAIRQRARRLVAHKVETEFAEDLPLVNVDSGLIEESCGQLLENAAKYSPSGSTISVGAKTEQGHVILSISDQGVGITPDEQQYLGRRSFRSQRHQATIPGSGLGFWIASTFVGANGGTIGISSPGQGLGTTASITLPASGINPSQLEVLTHE